MKKFLTLLFTLAAMFGFAGISNAGSLPYAIDNVEDFLTNSTYFNGYTKITGPFDFAGVWNYTAVAFESGNINYIRETTSGLKTFSTDAPGNFGEMKTVNFDTHDLDFSDGDPKDVFLSEFDPDDLYFKLFRLTADSKPLSFLTSKPVFQAGTYFIGFNDNGSPAVGDTDFDDLIVAATPVPEPNALVLLGTGLAGLLGLGRKMFRKS